jgi:hypothetical protein
MADRTAIDEAIEALMRADFEWFGCAEPGDYTGGTDYWRTILDALPAGLLRRLADQKDSGPLFEGTEDDLYDWLNDQDDVYRRVVVYSAPETTT